MKRNHFLLIFFAAILFSIEVKAQYLIVKSLDGSDKATELSSLRKLTFSDNKLVFYYTDKTSEFFDLTAVSSIYFGEYTTSVEPVLADSESEMVSVYPNPATNNVYIKNAPQGVSQLAVYRIDGTLMFKTQLESSSNQVDVSSLMFGLYILKIDNQSCKFVKL